MSHDSKCNICHVYWRRSGFAFMSGPPLLAKKCKIYTYENELYTKLIYFDYSNKNVENPTLRIIKIQVQQK